MAVADPAAVEDMIMIATCSLTIVSLSTGRSFHYSVHLLLKGPGLIHLKIPRDGRPRCMRLPSQYVKTSKKSCETLSVCGLK